MAAFTSLALLGLGLAGGLAASKLKKPALATDTVTAPGPTPTPAPATVVSPPSVIATESAAQAAARMASQRQRRRAAPGGMPSPSAGLGAPVASPSLQPRTLVGY